jgi:hypothetical protein
MKKQTDLDIWASISTMWNIGNTLTLLLHRAYRALSGGIQTDKQSIRKTIPEKDGPAFRRYMWNIIIIGSHLKRNTQ